MIIGFNRRIIKTNNTAIIFLVIFSNIGTIEKDLIKHAENLLACFKDLLEN